MDSQTAPSLKAYVMPVAITVVLGLVLFLVAGSLGFWQAWIYLAQFSVLTLFMVIYLTKRSPDLLKRRTDLKEQTTGRKTPAFLNLFLLIYIVPGLDFRFGLSAVPPWLVIVANIIVFLGYVLIIVVFRENSYASAVIKLENEQNVISTGPYAVVRHPMYSGMLLMTLFTPLALGSYWAFVPCAFFIPWLYLRIKNEEEVLLRGLKGYDDYRKKTRHRLLPYIW
jgi:protein-S-isoprenylcysteine O-methyltransferase Ste14